MIEELVRINRELERAVAIKDHVLSMASHDMRNPITSILGFASVLRSAPDDPALVETALDAIERQAMRLEHLVGDLLSLAVIDGGAVAIEPSEVRVAPLVVQVVSETPGGQACQVSVDDDLVVWADPDRLVQILGNLLSNAVKYGAEPYEIVARPDADSIELRVSDGGPGVAAEHVDGLFERFSPASRGAASDRRGTGLGLAIVKALAQLQGGDAWYEPLQPTGASFGVRLPARREDVLPVIDALDAEG
jgi:signal transduction histidine kinase